MELLERRFEGKVGLITGAASGQGRATAVRFAQEGANLALCDVQEDALAATQQLAETRGATVLAVRTDLADVTQIEDFIANVTDRFGKLDVVHNNAGVIAGGPIDAVRVEEWDRIYAVNVRAQFFLVQKALPLLRAAGGGIVINTSSTAGLVGGPQMAAYITSKHASVGLTKCLAIDLAPDNIRVYCLCPGGVDTPMPRATLETIPADRRQAEWERWTSHQLQQRWASPDEIANVAAFLASDESSFMTGTIIPVDGGSMASR